MKKENIVPLLELSGLTKSFHGVTVLQGVDFDVKKGEVHALVGENGAGKSTLIKIVAGIYSKDSGNIFVEGKPVEIKSPLVAFQLGIKVVFQELSLVPSLSVAENIYLERFPLQKIGPIKRIDWPALFENAYSLLLDLGLNIDVETPVEYLTMAQQQMTEIARALAYGAKIIAMDEPTSSLTPKEISQLFSFVQKLRQKGVSIIYVSHKLEEIFEISDRVTVLRDGRKIITRPTSETTTSEVIRSMVGRDIKELFPRSHSVEKKTMLEVRSLSNSKVHNISFCVREGEVVGIFGLMGAGRTELTRALFGLDRIENGEIFLEGEKIIPSPFLACKKKIALVTEDRKQDGLILPLSVLHNMVLASLNSFSRFGFIKHSEEEKAGRHYQSRLNIKCQSLYQKILHLSGGNQQKVIMARWLLRKPRLFIIDEPTRGIDVGSKAEIHKFIDDLALDRVAIIMITSELPELLGVSDRIMVMYGGRITGEFTREEATEEKIMRCAVGG